ncbi:hypothetical protein DUNSADRAFT_14279 [Dunaliella salina]|uniref:Uncharacterized protein n=1 Tax=Dunaliella salina TaxID=3046 RepID=A0ABQ7H2M0_DUNSA|nr:hypothetical protein DUNSADRAFT_14279 [Dunaliella salina]|eukprot:KAF5841104.1 hypothetical protein DUNSADRAFT_14279 [Dunaliella salina]
MASLSLDEVRDFLHANIRAAQRFSEEQTKVLNHLSNNECKEWLDIAQESLAKGCNFHAVQVETWQEMAEKMENYVSSVRALADDLALKELAQGSGQDTAEKEAQQQDARFVHPELRRFKAEKQARIVGKYGGAPALGKSLVLPSKPRDTILKATGTPAAREIAYSVSEGRDARELAEVMRFKNLAKEEGQSAWQAEVEAKKGRDFLIRDQLQEAAEAARAKAAVEAASHSPFSKELSDRLSRQQAGVQLSEEQQKMAEGAFASKAAKQKDPEVTDELAQKLARMQAQEQRAQEAASQQAQQASDSGASAPSTAWSADTPFGAELATKLQQRGTGSALKSAPQRKDQGGQQQPAAVNELQEKFRKLRQKEAEGEAS